MIDRSLRAVGIAALYQATSLPGMWRRWGIDGERRRTA